MGLYYSKAVRPLGRRPQDQCKIVCAEGLRLSTEPRLELGKDMHKPECNPFVHGGHARKQEAESLFALLAALIASVSLIDPPLLSPYVETNPACLICVASRMRIPQPVHPTTASGPGHPAVELNQRRRPTIPFVSDERVTVE